MTAFQIKIIAIVTMTIDHVGIFLFPEVFILRVIGRLAFLLFAWSLVQGAKHTSNIYLYFKRLLLFALISQIPFTLLRRQIYPDSLELNIFFTLALGLLSIIVIEQTKINRLVKAISIILIIAVAEILCGGFSYGAYGVVAILIFYLFQNNLKLTAIFQFGAILLFYTIPMALREPSLSHIIENAHLSSIQLVSLISLVFVAFYNKKQGPNRFKKLFYWFYPAHLVVIYLLSFLL